MTSRCSRKRTSPRRAMSVSRSEAIGRRRIVGTAARIAKRAAEDGRASPGRRSAPGEQGDDRLASCIVALVSARRRDPAAEQQCPAPVVEDQLARRRGAEEVRLDAVVVAPDADARYG